MELLVAVHVLPEGTLELLHHTVAQQVTLQLVLPVESRVTFVTREGQLTGVDQLVHL